MPIGLSFLPALAALSAETYAMGKDGLSASAHEATLTSILGASELDGRAVDDSDENSDSAPPASPADEAEPSIDAENGQGSETQGRREMLQAAVAELLRGYLA